MLSRFIATAAVLGGARASCTEDIELDLCGNDETGGDEEQETSSAHHAHAALMPVLILASAMSGKSALMVLPFLGAPLVAEAASPSAAPPQGTCGAVKDMYKQQGCCGSPSKELDFAITRKVKNTMFSINPCKGKKPIHSSGTNGYFNNIKCAIDGVTKALEQAGANITEGYMGDIDSSSRVPILEPYWKKGLCPVNVHWHLGAEHYSLGEFDETGVGPAHAQQDDPFGEEDSRRRLAEGDEQEDEDRHTRRLGAARLGFRCHHYKNNEAKFTTEYNWQHCKDMYVGETYEVHWPHSAGGDCGTPWQYQTPFYDGVFCNGFGTIITLSPLNTYEKIGVQGQIFTVVNDEAYYYPDLMRGMIMEGDFGKDIGHYTGSTTGTSRNNTICSQYAPITWQVDRKCHMISASSFDKMCADMKNQADTMDSDLHAHGARVLVNRAYAGNNLQRRV